MAVTYSSIPVTGTPFPREEYEERQRRVLAAMEQAGLDGLAVTAYGHQEYLGGYDGCMRLSSAAFDDAVKSQNPPTKATDLPAGRHNV